jgi:hypothetical protein
MEKIKININRTWKAATAIYLAVILNGNNRGKGKAIEGIQEMAETTDDLCKCFDDMLEMLQGCKNMIEAIDWAVIDAKFPGEDPQTLPDVVTGGALRFDLLLTNIQETIDEINLKTRV